MVANDRCPQTPAGSEYYRVPNHHNSSLGRNNVTADGPILRSDVQIAQAMAGTHATDKAAEGRIWRYQETWQAIPEHELRQEAMAYDSDSASLSKGRIDSILACLGDALGSDPDFFAARTVGINCANGLINFNTKGEP